MLGELAGFLHPISASPSCRHHPCVAGLLGAKEEDLGLMELQHQRSAPRDAGALGSRVACHPRAQQQIDPAVVQGW